jgi:uncharacterized membrane protein
MTATPTQQVRPRQQPGGALDRPADMGEAQRWLSVLGGSALALYGLSKGSLGGLALAAMGGGLACCGATGQGVLSTLGLTSAESPGLQIEETVTILRSPEELYQFWRDFENLPRFMKYLDSVQSTAENRWHWVARGPMNLRLEWDAEVTADRPNEMISWRSLPGSTVNTEGAVHFMPAPGNRGTWVKVNMRYRPPAGKVGAALAWLFGRSGEQEVRGDLRRFKQLLETGEIPTTRGQPSGRGREGWEQTGMMVLQNRFAKGLGWFGIGLGLAELLAPEAVANLIGVSDHHALLRVLGAREIATGVGILKGSQPAWLWGRVAGDAIDLTLLSAALLSPSADRVRTTAAATAAVLGVGGLDLMCSLKHSFDPEALS